MAKRKKKWLVVEEEPIEDQAAAPPDATDAVDEESIDVAIEEKAKQLANLRSEIEASQRSERLERLREEHIEARLHHKDDRGAYDEALSKERMSLKKAILHAKEELKAWQMMQESEKIEIVVHAGESIKEPDAREIALLMSKKNLARIVNCLQIVAKIVATGREVKGGALPIRSDGALGFEYLIDEIKWQVTEQGYVAAECGYDEENLNGKI